MPTPSSMEIPSMKCLSVFLTFTIALGTAAGLSGCAADDEGASPPQSESEDDLSLVRSRAAEVTFFSAFNAGDYARIPSLLRSVGESKHL